MPEHAYATTRFKPTEIEHKYGSNVHLIDDPLAWTLLAKFGSPETTQPKVGQLLKLLYRRLGEIVVSAEFPRVRLDIPTRMATSAPQAVYRGVGIAEVTKVVTVGIARAGTVPSQVIYEHLNEVIDPASVRQDHLFMSRVTNAEGQVTGAAWHDAKIGRDVEDRIVLFPDPMGATGSSMISAIDHYKTKLDGKPGRCITIHLIVTPEYIRNLANAHPDAVIYALRLDRGMSAPEVLASVPGTHPEQERGLDAHQYIVPGAGGVGEILNNAWI